MIEPARSSRQRAAELAVAVASAALAGASYVRGGLPLAHWPLTAGAAVGGLGWMAGGVDSARAPGAGVGDGGLSRRREPAARAAWPRAVDRARVARCRRRAVPPRCRLLSPARHICALDLPVFRRSRRCSCSPQWGVDGRRRRRAQLAHRAASARVAQQLVRLGAVVALVVGSGERRSSPAQLRVLAALRRRRPVRSGRLVNRNAQSLRGLEPLNTHGDR